MPKVKLAPQLEEIHGSLYDLVFKKSTKGKTFVTKKPDMSKVKWSNAQKAQRKHFAQGVAAVQKALADPKVRARYDRKARRLHKRAWDLAMSDYFNGMDLRARG